MDMDQIQVVQEILKIVVTYLFGEIFMKLNDFPLFEEAEAEHTKNPYGRFYKLNSGVYLDLLIYKKRIKILAELFLKEANYRAKKINKQAFCYVVGLGLGAWKLDNIQTKITIDVYLELIASGVFENISDLYFSWFNVTQIPSQIGNTMIHVGHRNPAEPLEDHNKLLVANWAWDRIMHM